MHKTVQPTGEISALDVRPYDLSREVDDSMIAYYVDELRGVYLPEDYVSAHRQRSRDVARWSPEDRLSGKFGRFLIEQFESDEDDEPFAVKDLLVIGTTMGVSGIDRYGYLHSLRHYDLRDRAWHILQTRDYGKTQATLKPQDYGATQIHTEEGHGVTKVSVSGRSLDYGRADTAGRKITCDLFKQLLGGTVEIVDADPNPMEREVVIR